MYKFLLFSLVFSSAQVFANDLCEKEKSISFNDCTLTTYDHGPANTGASWKVRFNGKIESVFQDGQEIIDFSTRSTKDGAYDSTTSYGVQAPIVTNGAPIPSTSVTYERSAECRPKILVLNILEIVTYHERQSRHTSKDRQIVKVSKNTITIEYYTKGSIQKLPNGPSYEMDPYQGNPSKKLVCKRI